MSLTPEEHRDWERTKHGFSWFLAISFIALGIIVWIVFSVKVQNGFHIPVHNEAPTMEATGQFGDFVGGVVGTFFSLSGVILLYITLNAQRKSFHRERFESRVFEMIKFLRENIESMRYDFLEIEEFDRHYPDGVITEQNRITATIKASATTHNGRRVFQQIVAEFHELVSENAFLFRKVDVKALYDNDYLKKLQHNRTFKGRQLDLIKMAEVDILYLILFYGNHAHGLQIVRSLCKRRYDKDFLEELIFYNSLKPAKNSPRWWEWSNLISIEDDSERNDVINKIKKDREQSKLDPFYEPKSSSYFLAYYPYDFYIPEGGQPFYVGHQSRLGHYFRNIFQSVKYIDNESTLDYKSKYEYVKMLRAQLSTDEQTLFFFNSVSILGRIWELENKHMPDEAFNPNCQLITKYNMIKNIPADEAVVEIFPRDIYPDVDFELINNPGIRARRDELSKQYY